MENWLKIKPAAKYAGISERTMRSWLKQGLTHSRLGTSMVLIHTTAVDDYIRKFEVCIDEADRIANEIMRDL